MPRKPRRIRAVGAPAPAPQGDLVIHGDGEDTPTRVVAKTRAPRGTGGDPVRSIRCSDRVWDRVKAKAGRSGVTPSYVAQVLLEGYANDQLDLPRVTVSFEPPGQEAG